MLVIFGLLYFVLNIAICVWIVNSFGWLPLVLISVVGVAWKNLVFMVNFTPNTPSEEKDSSKV